MSKKLTAKQRVLKKYPKAYAWHMKAGVPLWWIDKDDESAALGHGETRQKAWLDAANGLRRVDRSTNK